MDVSFDREYFEGGRYKPYYADFPTHQVIFDKLMAEKPESFVEIGSARGYLVRRMEQQGILALGYDISDYCIATRVANVHQLDIAAEPTTCFVNDKEFDLSFSISTLEHIPEDKLERAIKEIVRISKRGIHCISFNPNEQDKTVVSVQDKEWWENKFKEYAPGYPVKIFDRDEYQHSSELKFQPHTPVPGGIFAGRYVKEDLETMEFENKRDIILNVGSFTVMYASTPEFCIINTDAIDLRQFAARNGYNFFAHNAPQKFPLKDGTVSAIYCSHMMEHLDRKQGDEFLKQCMRVLKPGGAIRFAVPNAFKVCFHYVNHQNLQSKHGLYNIPAHDAEDEADALFHLLFDGHKTCYDREALTIKLTKNGFINANDQPQNVTAYPILGKVIMDMFPEISLYIEANKEEEPE